MAVGVRLAGASIPKAADLLGCFQPRFIKKEKIYSELQFSGLKCHVGVRGHMRKVKLLEADSKATVTQIITAE